MQLMAAYRPNGTAPSREPLPEPPPKSLHHNLEDLTRRLEAERTLTLSTPDPRFRPRPQQSESDQLHVDVVARLDEIVAGPPLGRRQVDHPLDREPRALNDRRLDCDLETLADERLADVLEGDPLHVRAEVAGAQELGRRRLGCDVVGHRA